MAEIVKTMKLHIHPQKKDIAALTERLRTNYLNLLGYEVFSKPRSL